MTEDNMILDREQFETVVFNEVQKMRHILFDLCCDDSIHMPDMRETRRQGKDFIEIPREEWERYENEVSEALGDLITARDLIKAMKPVFREYHEEYEQKHNICFDDYISFIVSEYDTDEFERVRERFEEERYQLFEDSEER